MNISSFQPLTNVDYREAQEAFTHLLQQDDLDLYASGHPASLEPFQHVCRLALSEAFDNDVTGH